jgi:hypothetical protein
MPMLMPQAHRRRIQRTVPLPGSHSPRRKPSNQDKPDHNRRTKVAPPAGRFKGRARDTRKIGKAFRRPHQSASRDARSRSKADHAIGRPSRRGTLRRLFHPIQPSSRRRTPLPTRLPASRCRTLEPIIRPCPWPTSQGPVGPRKSLQNPLRLHRAICSRLCRSHLQLRRP